MKLLVSRDLYKRARNRLHIHEQGARIAAYSYEWWQYIATDKIGNVFFLNTCYSVTTSAHQSEAESVLRRLGIRIDCKLRCRHDMHFGKGIDAALNDAIACLERENAEHAKLCMTPGTRKAKNAKRRELIKRNMFEMRDLERIRDVYLNKARIPHAKAKRADLKKRRLEEYRHNFKTPQGRIDWDALLAFMDAYQGWGRYNADGPQRTKGYCIDKILALYGRKDTEAKIKTLIYAYAQDLNVMLPEIDSDAYLKLKKAMDRLGATELCPLSLDKLHTYLINQVNYASKKERGPVEVIRFQVHPALEAIRNEEHVTILDSAPALRAEGRRQSHCIGSKGYIDALRRGMNYAVNYKGYTFWLGHDLQVQQTHGRFNSSTPESIRHELLDLIHKKEDAA